MDKISHYEWFHHVKETMNMCWNWIEEKVWSGHDLYERLDDEESETGLFSIHMNEVDAGLDDDADGIVEIDPFQGNLQAESAYWCVFDAVCYTIWSGFKFDNKGNKLPQPIESLSDETIDHRFMEVIRKVDGYQEEWSQRLRQYLVENDPAGSDKKIHREELLNLIA